MAQSKSVTVLAAEGPPMARIPSNLADQLADILAEALVADVECDRAAEASTESPSNGLRP
jgi:hypothetical protein